MITQEQLDAEAAAITAAQVQLAADQAAFNAAQPHLGMLARIESYAIHLPVEIADEFKNLINQAKELF